MPWIIREVSNRQGRVSDKLVFQVKLSGDDVTSLTVLMKDEGLVWGCYSFVLDSSYSLHWD